MEGSGEAAADCCPKDWQRFYLGYRERFVEDCCIPLPDGKEVRVKQAPSAKQFKQQQQLPTRAGGGGCRQQQQQQQQHGGPPGSRNQKQLDKQSDPALTGSTVWDGAVVLSQYLSSAASPLHEHRRTRAAAASTSTDNGPAAEADQPLSQDPSEAAADAGQQQPEQQHHQHRQHAQSEQADQQQQPGLQQAALQQQDWQLQGACPSLTPPSDPAQPAGAQLPGLTCLELGAGTGAVSLCLLAAGVVDCTLLTDIPDMLPHLQSNVEHNSSVLDPSRALVLPLRWAEAADVAGLQQAGRQQLAQRQRRGFGRQQAAQLPPVQLRPPFELIVGSDLIYYSYTAATPHSRLLLQALVQLAGPGSLIFLALSLHHNPEEVHAFLDWAEEVWGFGVERVTAGIPSEYVVPDVLVVRLHLRDTQRAQTAAAAAAAGTLRRKDEH